MVLLPAPTSSGPIPVFTLPGHSSLGQRYTSLPQCDADRLCRP